MVRRASDLPSVTNLNLDARPLEAILIAMRACDGTELDAKRIASGIADIPEGWDQWSNYVGALKAICVMGTDNRLTQRGEELADLVEAGNVAGMKRRLASTLLTETSLGQVVHVLGYVAPYYSGAALIDQTMRVLEMAFGVAVPNRKQLFNYTFKLLRNVGIVDEQNRPDRTAVAAAYGLDPFATCESLSSLSRDRLLVMQALVRNADKGWIRADALKDWIKDEYGVLLEVGRGGAALGLRLSELGLAEIQGGVGRGSRDTELRITQGALEEFLQSPLGKTYILRDNFESGNLFGHLDDIVGKTLAQLVGELAGDSPAETLEVVAAKIAFDLGCVDITIRSRAVSAELGAEGERDVLATIEYPFPYRVQIQCKAHEGSIGTADLYRELALALVSNNVRTILFFSTSGYTASTRATQRAITNAFPSLTFALFDGADLERLSAGEDAHDVIRERIREVSEIQRQIEEALSPRQLLQVASALESAGVEAGQRETIMYTLWPPIVDDLVVEDDQEAADALGEGGPKE